MSNTKNPRDLTSFTVQLRTWAQELGFAQLGIADVDLSAAEQALNRWLSLGYHGEMGYMQQHGSKRSRPAELVDGTLSIISVRMDYLPQTMASAWQVLESPALGYISRYALGRDYHKLLRKRLQQLADRISAAIGPFGYRVFVDSAPVLEKAIAAKAGLGWPGKHSSLLTRNGSWFFLGEIYTDLPLTADPPVAPHCGSCTACLDICPTAAIVAPYEVDARRCISYLTIELHGAIPTEFRPLLGNRIYGCDDCQLICPWNRFAQHTCEKDFLPRGELAAPQLIELFQWDEATFLRNTEGSPLRRLGHERWLRNIAVALGNAPTSPAVVAALQKRRDDVRPLVSEHTRWALQQHPHGE
ncbi:MAG TPA: tRNA epoxyqueuosine(34) reductase QueG [Gammaproteobacteria bacterium]